MISILPRSTLALTALLGLVACDSGAAGTEWELVGAYDASATLQAGAIPMAGYVWNPSTGMNASCGPSKGPLGMGIFEAEALGNGLTPTLALVLHYGGPGKPEPLTPSTLQIALVDPDDMENPDRRFSLEPGVLPRRLAMEISGAPATQQIQQLVRTQVSIELCLEHKVGRAWLGSDADRVRQAFMLDRPSGEGGIGEDRRYFVGQRDPVPALLGPPDACEVVPAGQENRSEDDGLSGAGATRMVASDIWGAALRPCISRDPNHPERGLVEPELLTLRSSTPWGNLIWEPPAPRRVNIDLAVDGDGHDVFDLKEVTYAAGEINRRPLLDTPARVFPKADEPGSSTDLTDIMALVPHQYPLVRDGASPFDDPNEPGSDWYAVLLIPDWQIVQGVSLLERGVLPRRASGPRSGVTWLLAHPEALSVQVAPGAERLPADLAAAPDPDAGDWPDLLATAIGREWKGLRDWGYTVGLLHGRKPVFLPAAEPPTWAVAQLAQRAYLQGGFLVGLSVFMLVVGVGARRLRDLWTPVPKERADYWPGVGIDENIPDPASSSPSSTVPAEG